MQRPLYAVFLLLLTGCFTAISLPAQSDWGKVRNHVEKQSYEPAKWHKGKLEASWNPLKMLANTGLFIYQRQITYQVHAQCTFHPSCSEFSRQAILRFGFAEGLLLTLDRLSRCNGFEARRLQGEPTQNGRFADPPQRYRFR